MRKEEKQVLEEIKNFNWDADFNDEGKRVDDHYNEYAIYKIEKWQKLLNKSNK